MTSMDMDMALGSPSQNEAIDVSCRGSSSDTTANKINPYDLIN